MQRSELGARAINLNRYLYNQGIEDDKTETSAELSISPEKLLPIKFTRSHIKIKPTLLREIKDTYHKKQTNLNRQIMVNNIKYATNQKILLMSNEGDKKNQSTSIRHQYKTYLNTAQKQTTLTQKAQSMAYFNFANEDGEEPYDKELFAFLYKEKVI